MRQKLRALEYVLTQNTYCVYSGFYLETEKFDYYTARIYGQSYVAVIAHGYNWPDPGADP